MQFMLKITNAYLAVLKMRLQLCPNLLVMYLITWEF